MTHKAVNIFKGVILAFGLAVYAIAFALLTGGRETEPREVYLWVMFGVVYLAFFIPALFNNLTFKSFAHSAAGVVLLWNADIVFCFVTVALSLAVYYERCSIAIAVVIEMAMLFVALILVFVSSMASSHVQSVGAREEKAMSKIKELRSGLSGLDRAASSSDIGEDIKRTIKALAEDARYISPVESEESALLEEDIIKGVREVKDALQAAANGERSGRMQRLVDELKMKMAERKALRN